MKTSLGNLTLEKIKALTENSTLAQTTKLYDNSVMAQASKLYESSAMAQASKLYENSAIAQASKLIALTTPIKDLLNLQEFSGLENLFHQTEKDVITFWQQQNTQHQLAMLIGSHTNLSSIVSRLSDSYIETYVGKNHYFELVEDCAFASDEVILTQESNNKIECQNNLIKLLFIWIIFPILLNQISSYVYEFHLQPLAKEYHSAKSEKEFINHIKANTYFDKSLLKPYRITSKPTNLYTEAKLKSAILEKITQYTLVEKIEDPNLHKSWLKVRIEINGEILEGYVLRSYTSPIK